MKSIILKSQEVIHLRDTGSVIAWRVVKPQPTEGLTFRGFIRESTFPKDNGKALFTDRFPCASQAVRARCPYGRTGEERWVKETWMEGHAYDADGHGKAYHKACWGNVPEDLKWRSPVHMPRWASRFTVTLDVGLKRIQEVTEEEAIASGIEPLFTEEEIKDSPELADCRGQWSNYLWHGHHGKYGMGNAKSDRWPHQFSSYSSAVGSYSSLHESIHGQGSWDRNDYFWKITCTLTK